NIVRMRGALRRLHALDVSFNCAKIFPTKRTRADISCTIVIVGITLRAREIVKFRDVAPVMARRAVDIAQAKSAFTRPHDSFGDTPRLGALRSRASFSFQP